MSDSLIARRLPDLSENLEWNLVLREERSAVWIDGNKYTPIPDRFQTISDSNVLAIGVTSNNAPRNWYTGGFVSKFENISPSSTSVFNGVMESFNKKMRLHSLNLVVFPKLEDNWILRLSTPKWFSHVLWEVWRYDGRDLDLMDSMNSQWVLLDLIPPSIPYAWVFALPSYTKDFFGKVHLKGVVNNLFSLPQSIAYLPEGYRPNSQLSFSTASSGVSGRIDVQADGLIIAYGGDSFISLDGVSFDVV